MEHIDAKGLSVWFEPEDAATAELAARTCEESARLIRELLGLALPEGVRVYIMTDWRTPIYHAAGPLGGVVLRIAEPVWGAQARRLWPLAGGWEIPVGRRRVLGVKPPRLIAASDRTLGERLFIREENPDEKTRHLVCHELTHVCTRPLRLPLWLNEGLAMGMVDRLLGKETIQRGTLDLLAGDPPYRRETSRGVLRAGCEGMLYAYARGYWTTRLLLEVQPDLLPGLLRKRRSRRALEKAVAGAVGIDPARFWPQMTALAQLRFGPR